MYYSFFYNFTSWGNLLLKNLLFYTIINIYNLLICSDCTSALHHYVYCNTGHRDSFFSKIRKPTCKWQKTSLGDVAEKVLC